jgi:hypothetical protein
LLYYNVMSASFYTFGSYIAAGGLA